MPAAAAQERFESPVEAVVKGLRCGDYPLWRDTLARGPDRVEVRFVGRGRAPRPPLWEVLAAIEPAPPPLAWVRQVHSTTVIDAVDGPCGDGDALVTHRRDLALSVVTADCVPVLLAAEDEGEATPRIAAVHAGWRGIAGGIVGAAARRLRAEVVPAVAWIGPSIGPCCYEVGGDVARRVAEASAPAVIVANPRPARGRPHLDLRAAVRRQLEVAGVQEIRELAACTRCQSRELWSFRREGMAAGRNHAFIWVATADG